MIGLAPFIVGCNISQHWDSVEYNGKQTGSRESVPNAVFLRRK